MDKKQLKGGFILLQFEGIQSITAGQAGQQEHKKAGHRMSSIRKQKVMTIDAQLTLSF